MKQILGIDWGGVRVGLAVGSRAVRLARPLTTLSNSPKLLDKLREVYCQEQIEYVVVGLPRNLEGAETAQSAVVRRFAAICADALDCELAWQDETLSTQAAADLRKRYPKASPDALAATVILQDHLNTL